MPTNRHFSVTSLFAVSKHRHQQHWRVPTDDSTVVMRRYLLMAVVVVFLVVMAIVLLTRVGRGVADRDPSLDWRMNPNLKTGD